MKPWLWWIFLTWHALVGIWPYASPEHDLASFTSALDVGVHVVAIVALALAVRTNRVTS